MDSKHKVVITGANQGIGFELTRIFLENGNSVLAISRQRNQLDDLQKQYEALEIVQGDIAHPETRSLIQHQLAGCRIRILVNNAGLLVNKPFLSLEGEEMEAMFRTNVFAAAQLIQAIDSFLERGSHVVNIGSMGGYQGSSKFPGLSMYSASKAALACLTECLAEEYEERGVDFNCLALGATQTGMLEKAFPGYTAPVDSATMAGYIYGFCKEGNRVFRGKILPVSVNTP